MIIFNSTSDEIKPKSIEIENDHNFEIMRIAQLHSKNEQTSADLKSCYARLFTILAIILQKTIPKFKFFIMFFLQH